MIYQVAVINGSLRKASIHAGLLRVIIATNDKRFKFDWVNIDNFPMFNEDIEVKGIPL
jgi:NAD(P)H-dependent FMN reductase